MEFFNKAEHEARDLEFNYEDISDEEAEKDFRLNISVNICVKKI